MECVACAGVCVLKLVVGVCWMFVLKKKSELLIRSLVDACDCGAFVEPDACAKMSVTGS